jgi:hypothetical protein
MMFGLMLIPMAGLRLMWSLPYGNNNVTVLDSIRGRVIVLVGGYDVVNCKVVEVVVAVLKVYYP